MCGIEWLYKHGDAVVSDEDGSKLDKGQLMVMGARVCHNQCRSYGTVEQVWCKYKNNLLPSLQSLIKSNARDGTTLRGLVERLLPSCQRICKDGCPRCSQYHSRQHQRTSRLSFHSISGTYSFMAVRTERISQSVSQGRAFTSYVLVMTWIVLCMR